MIFSFIEIGLILDYFPLPNERGGGFFTEQTCERGGVFFMEQTCEWGILLMNLVERGVFFMEHPVTAYITSEIPK